MSSLLSRIDTSLIYLPFLMKVRAVLDECSSRGSEYWAISGFRSYGDQEGLYAQSRSMPGPRVTNARPGESAHNFGAAIDLARDGYIERKGLQPDWRPASYDVLGEVATAHGLEWGGHWEPFKDRPHLQMPGYVTQHELKPLREAYECGGLVSVFHFLDAQELLNA